jgi:hypothetical protein
MLTLASIHVHPLSDRSTHTQWPRLSVLSCIVVFVLSCFDLLLCCCVAFVFILICRFSARLFLLSSPDFTLFSPLPLCRCRCLCPLFINPHLLPSLLPFSSAFRYSAASPCSHHCSSICLSRQAKRRELRPIRLLEWSCGRKPPSALVPPMLASSIWTVSCRCDRHAFFFLYNFIFCLVSSRPAFVF